MVLQFRLSAAGCYKSLVLPYKSLQFHYLLSRILKRAERGNQSFHSFIRYSCLLWACIRSVRAWPKTFATLHLYKPIRSKTVSLSHSLFPCSMPARSTSFEVGWFIGLSASSMIDLLTTLS